MTPVAEAVSRALIHFVWQGGLVGLLLWVTLFAMRRKSANVRYIASCSALGVMAILPVLTAWLLYSRPGVALPAAASALGAPQIAAAVTAPFQQGAWLTLLQRWALPIWSAGVLFLSLRLVLGYRHAFQLRRRGKPAGDSITSVVQRLVRSMGVSRRVAVLISSLTETPSMVGWLRPVILLPAATLMGLTPLQLEAILAHEIGHIKRYDYLVNMLQMVVETVLFYHPAVWWTSRRIRVERELCCDDLAVQFSGNALRYARALTTLEKLRLRSPAVAMASTDGPLLYRIQRLAGVSSREYGPSRLPAVFAVALGAICILLSVTWVRGQDAPGVRVDLGGSSVIHRGEVPFPETVRKQGVTGTVQLEVTLDDAGNVVDAHVLSGPQELRKTSLESVLNWHFTKEAAKGTRLVNITYSNDAKQVRISEPESRSTERTYTTFRVDPPETTPFEFVFRRNGEQEPVALTERQQLERQIQEVRKRAAEAENSGEPESVRAELKLKMAELQRTLEATPLQGSAERAPFEAIKRNGVPIKSIAVFGVSESVQADLLSHLPVRLGDLLSARLLEETQRAVREYDEHLRMGVVGTIDGQVELRITTGEEPRREGRR
jgi:beta-lactamase regulating signal transducer with metallopeptidase domain